MMYSLVASLRALFWSIVVVIFFFYIFALLLMQGVAGGLLDKNFDEDVILALLDTYGTMSKTMLTLYKAGTGGADWGEYYDLVSMFNPWYGVLFQLYIAFFMFSVINVTTGLIVEHVGEIQTKEKDRETARKAESEESKRRQKERQSGCTTSDAPSCGPSWKPGPPAHNAVSVLPVALESSDG